MEGFVEFCLILRVCNSNFYRGNRCEEAIQNTIQTLVNAINSYKLKNPFKSITESTLIQIGYDSGILK